MVFLSKNDEKIARIEEKLIPKLKGKQNQMAANKEETQQKGHSPFHLRDVFGIGIQSSL